MTTKAKNEKLLNDNEMLSQTYNFNALTEEEKLEFNEKIKKIPYGETHDNGDISLAAERIRNEIIAARGKLKPRKFERRYVEKILTLPNVLPIIREKHISPLSNWLAKTSIVVVQT
jgi:hypothetical protein